MILRRYYYCDHGCPAYVFGYGTVGRASETRGDGTDSVVQSGTAPMRAQA